MPSQVRIREAEGVVYDGLFATHSGNHLDDEGLELAIRRQALLWRGILIADSDLNNQPAFHGRLNGSTALRRAIEIGLIQRAARKRPDGPIAQLALLEELASSSRQRAAEVPRQHVAELQRLLDKTEATTSPVLWEEERVGKVFALRLVGALASFEASPEARESPRAMDVARRLGHHVREYLREDATVDLRAATLERFCAGWKTSAPEKLVWQVVLNCYDGNVPATWNGQIASLTRPSFPAGPEASEEELQFAIAFYEAIASSDPEAGRNYSVRRMPIEGRHQRWQFDDARLIALSLDQVVEIRERANADAFFAARYAALAGPADALVSQQRLARAEDEYLERLHQAGVALTQQAESDRIDHAWRWVVEHNRTANSRNSLAAMAGLVPFLGDFLDARTIARCAANENQAKQGTGPLVDEALASVTRTTSLVLTRPDYRVIERRARHVLESSDD